MAQQIVGISRKKSTEPTPKPHIDPVCKMLVSPESAAAAHDYNNLTYYFCMPACRDKFIADPEKYLSEPLTAADGGPTQQSFVHSEAEYTCPMHPEIVQIGPGSC